MNCKDNQGNPDLIRNQNGQTVRDDRACCICGDPVAPHERMAMPEHGIRGLRFCAAHGTAFEDGFVLPGDSVSGGGVSGKKRGAA